MPCREIIICPTLRYWTKNKAKSAFGDGGICAISGNKERFFFSLLTSGKLNGYLAQLDKQAEDMYFRLIKQMAEREGVTEQLKAENQMEWVGRMNNIRSRAMETVNAEVVYS